jgi:hypothetical protein
MFDRVNFDAIDVADGRSELGIGDSVVTGGNCAGDAGMIGSAEDDARTFGRRKQDDCGEDAGVYAYTLADHPVFNRRLKRHYPSQNQLALPDRRGP